MSHSAISTAQEKRIECHSFAWKRIVAHGRCEKNFGKQVCRHDGLSLFEGFSRHAKGRADDIAGIALHFRQLTGSVFLLSRRSVAMFSLPFFRLRFLYAFKRRAKSNGFFNSEVESADVFAPAVKLRAMRTSFSTVLRLTLTLEAVSDANVTFPLACFRPCDLFAACAPATPLTVSGCNAS